MNDAPRGAGQSVGRSVTIEADGGSRGNPGPAGYGAVVKDRATGRVLAERAAGIGRATNNVAEYGGLLAGLRAAIDLGADDVEVRMDSKLVVEQMSGRWKVKHPAMVPLAKEAGDLVRRFGRVRFAWIPRADNAHADRLANEAMDAAARGDVWAPDAADEWLAAHESVAEVPAVGGPAVAEPALEGPTVEGQVVDGRGGDLPVERTNAVAGATPAPAVQPNRLIGWASPSEAPTTMLLLRHGQTPLSVQKRFSGVGDPDLTDTGRAQAAAAAARLADSGATAVITSPLARARQTAALVAAGLGLEVAVDEGLRETDFGEWDGFTFAEIKASRPEELERWLASTAVAPPGGESFDDTADRVLAARDRLLSSYAGQTIVVVSHVTPIKTLLRFALDAPPSALYRIHLDLACISTVQWFADGPSVVCSLNDVGHLAGLHDGAS